MFGNKKTILLVLVLTLALVMQITNADFTFGEPTNLGSAVNSPDDEFDMSLSSDELMLVFSSNRPGGLGKYDLWMTSRPTVSDPWAEPVNLGPTINTSEAEMNPALSDNGLTLYFASNRPDGVGWRDIWVSTRESIDDDWGEPVNMGPTINTTSIDGTPFISVDGLELYFTSLILGHGPDDHDIRVSTRETKDDPWGEAVNLGPPVNTTYEEFFPKLSADGLTLFFSSGLFGTIERVRPGGLGDSDIWVTRRKTRDANWAEPVNIGPPVNSVAIEWCPVISADGSTLYFVFDTWDYPVPDRGNLGWGDICQAPIIPIVDFNGDGVVDAADMCIMVGHWDTDNQLCDIGPMPWGDGIVDVEDLKVLAEHLFEEVKDPTLISHWELDETEGMTAHNSVNGNEDFVMGGPVWQPAGGMIGGALEMDGIDDCIISSTGPNPAEGTFSIVVWIKCGTPGQVIISQPNGSDWLAVDGEGKLMTELNGLALLSQALITDEQWHRIGLVWDGSRRTLIVDSVIVAEDTLDGAGVFGSGLYIGVGNNYATSTFFSGLIDDVRIYNRVVSP